VLFIVEELWTKCRP